MPKRKVIKPKKFSLLIPIISIVIAVVGWLVYSKLQTPIGINQIVSYGTGGLDPSRNVDSNGCVYTQVQCFQAPCEPVISCPPNVSPAPTPTPAATPGLDCVSWFDGCNTCVVKDGVIAGCTLMACKTNTEKPRCLNPPAPTPISVEPTNPPSTPTPSTTPLPSKIPLPSPMMGIASFKASRTCGPSHFLSIVFTCNNGAIKDLANNSCTDIASAITIAQSTCGKEVQ